ncbi:MAG: hypothetical protein CSB13_02315 [Chloroflexi bacterium]|nr:MAG: hypothetical protein CSB13_02315 [Chloroflexota bacterium]
MTVSEQMKQENQQSGSGQQLWDLLSRPASSITDRAQRRAARTLSAFLLTIFIVIGIRLVVDIVSSSYVEELELFIAIASFDMLIFISYIVSRTKKYTWGATIAVLGTIIMVLLTIIIRGDYTPTRMFANLMWLVPALILGSAFSSWRTTALIAGFTFISIWLMPTFIPSMEMDAAANGVAILLVVSLLVVVTDRFRDQLESDRRAAINAANKELELASQLLEKRVNERTRDLELAAEISRVLSQITNLDDLLQESVEKICTQFDLYYAQIYLADPTTNSLALQAGTGDVGQKLVRRGHRLVIGSGSINGVAASEKRAVIVSDTAASFMFKPNALLPRTRSELALPLVIGERVVGVLHLQGTEVNAFTQENLPAFEALGGQLAVAIENAQLLSDAAEARAAIESFTRRISREGWDSYLDAVSHPHFIGYSFAADAAAPITEPFSQKCDEGNMAQVPIDVVGETVGAIQVEAEEERVWTAKDLDLIQSVATQVGQQVEMLRSLDEAAKYRQEAERALQRVTHEAWLTYEETAELAHGFTYDQVEVKPTTAVSLGDDPADFIHHDLAVHGEPIGELAISKPEQFDQEFTDKLVTAVANQLVNHIENLRLTEQTEKALAETQRQGRELAIINRVVSQVSQAGGLHNNMQIIVDELVEATQVDQARIALLDSQQTKVTIVAENFDTSTNQSALGMEIPLAGNLLTQTVLESQKPIFIKDVLTSPYTKNIRDMLKAQHIQSFLVMPIVINHVSIGTIGLDILDTKKTITDEQVRLAETLMLQAATAIQKAQLFEQTEARAEELAVINEVAQIVSQQREQTEVMQAVYEQIQRILPVDTFFIALHNKKTGNIDYPYWVNDNRVQSHPSEAPESHNAIYQVLQTAKPALIHQTPNETGELHPNHPGNPPASLMYIPLIAGQEILGILSIQTRQTNAYDQGSLDLLVGIANHVALSLENTRLLQNTQRAAKREQMLREISSTINTSIDAESVLQTAAREIGRALGIEAYVYLAAPEPETVEQAEHTQPNPDQKGGGYGS